MKTSISDYIVKSQSVQWLPLVEKNVNTKGIYVKSLRRDEAENRSPSILLRFEPGAKYPYHNHPAGEEIFVMEGTAIIEGQKLSAGDYLYTPPGFKHSVTTETGCTLMLVIPQEVEILEK
ncbi:MAG: cupin domain-containing protein [Cyclobacteriaceae bacterium]|nr:cupin domain-containing protein [Cyclobacteriaceae bacterium]UYN87264.1 MAG: cupin domain-containing protein [Cyclobacteriaceae bacterium]